MESAAEGDQAMGMKGYVGDLARMFGSGVMGPGRKEKPFLPHPPFIPEEGKTGTPVRFRTPRKGNQTPADDSPGRG